MSQRPRWDAIRLRCCLLQPAPKGLYWGYIGVYYWGYIGMMEKKMEVEALGFGVSTRLMTATFSSCSHGRALKVEIFMELVTLQKPPKNAIHCICSAWKASILEPMV